MNNDLNKFFRWKCFSGLKKRGFEGKLEYIQRLEYELGIIEKLNFAPYFLVVQDFIGWARNNNILVGPGRGSAAGSLIAYCLWITQLDPIRYELYFERFLNTNRIAPPDVDVDFQDDKRELVIEYIKSKYGSDHVSGISTFGLMKCRGAIKAAARTLGVGYTIGDLLSKLTPTPINGIAPKLSKCYEQVPELEKYHSHTYSPEGKTLLLADQIEDRVDKAGQHASAIIIGNAPLHEIVPLINRKEGVCSEWDMHEVENIGLIKFDFLGLTALTVMSKTLELIQQRHGIKVDLDQIDLEDNAVLDRLRSGDVAGIFQLETSPQMRDLLVKMKPTSMEDIGLLTAIFRPGPLASPYMSQWLKVRAGEENPTYLHPGLEPILKPTGGWLIYQESMMKIAVDLAGYTLLESDELRKACGKKLPAEMAKHEQKLISGLINKSNFSPAQAQTLWEDIKAFAGYSFNKAHSAAYGLIAYQTAWLKTHYTAEYMCALLTCNQNDVDQVIKYIFDGREHNINVLPPDINISAAEFSIDKDGNIRFGLAAIKNLGIDIVKSIINARGNIKFNNLEDFISRIDLSKVNKRKLESLVLAGAFDFSGHTRAAMINIIEQSIDYRHEIKSFESKLQTYNKKIEAWRARNEQIKNEEIAGKKSKLKSLKEPKRPEELTKPTISSLPEIAEKELLNWEKELLGFYVSGHPVEKFNKVISSDPSLSTVASIKTLSHNGAIVNIIGIPTSINERTTKSSGKKMASMILEDLTGNINLTAFPKTWEQYSFLFQSNEPLLFTCKIAVQDAGDTGGTITELFAQNVSSIKHLIQFNKSKSEINIPADMDKVNQLKELLDAYSGDEAEIKVNLQLRNGTKLPVPKKFTIRSVEMFLQEISKGIN